MIIDSSRSITQWHQPFYPADVYARSIEKGGSIQKLPEGKDAKYIALSASSQGTTDTLILPRSYRRLLPEQLEDPKTPGAMLPISNARTFQSRARTLEIYNSWADPMDGFRIALRTMDTRGHYVGASWFKRTKDEEPQRNVVMGCPLVEGPELVFATNGKRSKELYGMAGEPHMPITVQDYGDVCLVTLPSRSKKVGLVKRSKKAGEEFVYHDVRLSNLPIASKPENHWANTHPETDNPDEKHKLRRYHKRLQVFWQDDSVASWYAIRFYKETVGDPLSVQLFPIPGRALIELDNCLRYNVFIELEPYGIPPARALTETERSYLLMAYIQAAKENSPRRDLYEMLFREDVAGLEDDLIKVAA